MLKYIRNHACTLIFVSDLLFDLFIKKVAGWDPLFLFYYLLVDCREQFENIALAKLSSTLGGQE